MWQRAFHVPQTYFLIIGMVLGWGLFVVLLGTRWLVLVVGGAIALVTVLVWVRGFVPKLVPLEAVANLLERENLLTQLNQLDAKIPKLPNTTWTQARQWAEESQSFSERIAAREPTLTADLLETMHTVLELTGQVAGSIQVLEQIETPSYRELAQQRLQQSCDRLRESRSQLQRLHDQVTLAALDQGVDVSRAALPNRLQILIADNKTTLQSASDSAPHP